MTTESVKINTEVLNKVRKIKKETGVSITMFIQLAIQNEIKKTKIKI